jgi:hypothetical protein
MEPKLEQRSTNRIDRPWLLLAPELVVDYAVASVRCWLVTVSFALATEAEEDPPSGRNLDLRMAPILAD